MNIKAAIARAHGAPLVIEDLVLDTPRDDEIVVRLVASGVANVDRAAIAGTVAMPLPFVPGSEGAGIVEQVGAAVTDLKAGDSVLVGYASCAACEPCATSNPRACRDFATLNFNGRRLDGTVPFATADTSRSIHGFFLGQSSFATHMLCRAASAIKLPVGAPLEILACLGGELLAGAAVIRQAFDLQPGDTLVITGADTVALLACMVAKASGAKTIVVADPDEARRSLALECGATVTVAIDADLEMTTKSLVADGFRFALDTTGHAATIEACLASLAPGGVYAALHPVSLSPLAKEVPEGHTLLSPVDVRPDPETMIPELVAMQMDGRLPIDRIVGFFPFELVNDALAALGDGSVVKPVLRFPLGSFGDLDRALTEKAAREADEPKHADEKDPAAPAPAPVEA